MVKIQGFGKISDSAKNHTYWPKFQRVWSKGQKQILKSLSRNPKDIGQNRKVFGKKFPDFVKISYFLIKSKTIWRILSNLG